MPTINRSSILHIDDDRDEHLFLIQAINSIDKSVECLSAISAEEAFKILDERNLNLPSVIILDLNMPRISGKDFLKIIGEKQEYNHIPVIVYTISNYETDKIESMKLGAKKFLTKKSSGYETKKDMETLLQEYNILSYEK